MSLRGWSLVMSQVAMNVVSPRESTRKKMQRLQRALFDAVTGEDIAAISRKMQEKAQEGSVAAAKLVFSYVFGRPEKPISYYLPDREEGSAAMGGSGVDGEALLEEMLREAERERAGQRASEGSGRANGLNGGGGRARDGNGRGRRK